MVFGFGITSLGFKVWIFVLQCRAFLARWAAGSGVGAPNLRKKLAWNRGVRNYELKSRQSRFLGVGFHAESVEFRLWGSGN